MHEVPASEFAKNFGIYHKIAQREPVAVLSHGRLSGYFISTLEFEELQRLRARAGRSRALEDLSAAEIEEMLNTRMSPEHDHLNRLLDEE
jgi:PHD/YefM family antitoxin component YafN of YafNO toxin-antitoxin module